MSEGWLGRWIERNDREVGIWWNMGSRDLALIRTPLTTIRVALTMYASNKDYNRSNRFETL